MRKMKVFLDFNEEEKYLNDMARKGHLLKKYSVFGIYHFAEGEPQELTYKIDYKIFRNNADFQDYKALFEDAGWIHVYGTKQSGNQYFLPMNKSADGEIFSSRESAAFRYKTLYNLCSINVAVAAMCIIAVFSVNGFKLSSFGFLTPGLWEMTGASFWRAFFFEVPFVMFRLLGPIALVGMGILYGYWGSKAKKTYDLQMKGCENQ